jgi:hypothetical protein
MGVKRMRSITENQRDRMVAQAEEAEVRGLTKIAEHLTYQIEKTAVRPTDSFYSYAKNEFQHDIETALWAAILRVADFHDKTIDPVDAQEIVEKFAEDLIHDVRVKAGADSVGAHEPNLPGEIKEHISIELSENE